MSWQLVRQHDPLPATSARKLSRWEYKTTTSQIGRPTSSWHINHDNDEQCDKHVARDLPRSERPQVHCREIHPKPTLETNLRSLDLIDLHFTRVDNWLLMASPWPVLGLCMLYIFVVWYAGPAFMKHRQPYDIKLLMITYNLFQTLLSLWLFQKASYFWLTGRYNWICQPVDYSRSKDGMLAVDMTWWFFFSKLIDTIDSLFFVLRKKWAHLSNLHVFHHGIMPLTSWVGTRWVKPTHK